MNRNAPVWMRVLAHVQILLRLWVEKIFANLIIMLVLVGIATYLHGSALTLPNILAVIVGYTVAFMVNFYAQFARYRDVHLNLASDRAASLGEMTEALDREYHDMMKRQPQGQ